MKNNLDSFNKDKIKCKKCKSYYDPGDWVTPSLCTFCNEKWLQYWYDKRMIKKSVIESDKLWEAFLNEQ
jgi:hypothetical protein